MTLVQVEKANFVCTLKLNRPDKLNALSWDLIDALSDALKETAIAIQAGTTRVVLLGSSAQKAFCAGADLAERLQMKDDKVIETLSKLGAVTALISGLAAPTIAVLEGVAFGGGLEIALACDLRIAAPNVQLGLTETGLAIIPGAGGTQRLPRLIGEARAKELIYLGRKVSGADAAEMGLVNVCVGNAWTLANVWAKEITARGPLALRIAKEAIDGGISLPLAEGLAYERESYLKLLCSTDRKEGLLAFAEKRAPNFSGK